VTSFLPFFNQEQTIKKEGVTRRGHIESNMPSADHNPKRRRNRDEDDDAFDVRLDKLVEELERKKKRENERWGRFRK
jgi:hypothetical protein